MYKKFGFSRLFRLITTLAVISLLFSQFVGTAQADEPKPGPGTENVDIVDKVSLDELEGYYGHLGTLEGIVGVVVEFKDTPAALIYAEGSTERAKQQTQQIRSAQAGFLSSLKAQGIKYTELYRTQKVYNGIWMRVDVKDVKKLAATSGVKAIHPMVPKTIDHTTSVPLIGAPQVWAGLASYLGENVTVGVIDTGVDYIHTNFGGPGDYTGQDFSTVTEADNLFPTPKVVGGYDFAGDDYNADPASASYNPIPTPDLDPMDCNGHGSHVSGTVAGFGVLPDGSTFEESAGDGYSDLASLTSAQYVAKFRIGPGVAPKASLYGLRVFGCEGSTDLTEQAIEWAMDPNNDGDFSDHLDVINMSLGSSYGTEYDSSAAASNNAAQAGIIVVTSAGNSGDLFYITGAPGMARYAISTANSVDSGAVVSAFEAIAPAALAGMHPAVEAAFGPDPGTPGLTGDVVTTTPANGCTAITSVVTGKIALIDRGVCSFDVKVINAQNAGAVGVLVANNVAGFPFGMGASGTVADPTIPSMMTTKAVGDAIKTQLALPATVTIRLTSQYKDQFQLTDTAVEDTLVSSSSRGPARGGTLLKPDLAAPGDSIFSTATGTGSYGVSYGGTSMASPHVAGMMALLREQHPEWSVTELKALAMNTATNDLYTGLSHTGVKYVPSRIGAGRVSAAKAVKSDVVAFYQDDPGQVSVAFGQVALVSTRTYTKSITIENKGAATQAYNVTFDSRYTANPGITFTLLDAGGATLTNPVSVSAASSLEIKVKVTVNPATIARPGDPTIASGASRQRFTEAGGYVTLTSTSTAPTLRVPVYIAARPAASMTVAETSLELPAADSGTFDLTLSGNPVDTIDDTSLAFILEYMGMSPNEDWSLGPNDAADLQYVGVSSDYPYKTFANGKAFFGFSTYGAWDTANVVEFDVYIDVNEDATPDYVVYNTGLSSDSMYVMFCELSTSACDYWTYVNHYSGAANTNLFQNNVMVMPVYLTDIGLEQGVNTDFDFQVVTWNREFSGPVDISDTYHFDVDMQSFDTVDPVYTGAPVWYDIADANPTFTIGYDKANIAANDSKGLLFLRTHNTVGVNTAQVVMLPPMVKSIVRKDATPTSALSVDFTVTFTNWVTGVDASDFVVASTGLSGAKVTAVNGVVDALPGGAPIYTDTYVITVDTGSGSGTLGLNVVDNDTITDQASSRLGGMGLGNGDYADGEVYTVNKMVKTQATVADFDGNGSTDISIFRTGNGNWYIKDQFNTSWGVYGDSPVPGDYDGDGSVDVAIYRSSLGQWFVEDQFAQNWGVYGDVAVPGDYDGNGTTDIAVFRPSTGEWFVKDQFVAYWGKAGDIPVPGDYDGDGDTDVAVYRPSKGQWFVMGQFSATWGLTNIDIAVPGDYDGDGDTDVAVYRPSTGQWFVKDQFIVGWGSAGDIPVPGDYDGDGDIDVAIYRPSTGEWVGQSFYALWGGVGDDYPLPARDTNSDGGPYQDR